jgi:alkylation response protein AidB-like acyl-CoA dehydrogenase
MGLNGVDNGQIWFSSVRVPRDAMLDRYASVDAAGNYSSPIPTVSARFGTMVGGLTTGRILIAQGAVSGLSLAYCQSRKYVLHVRLSCSQLRMCICIHRLSFSTVLQLLQTWRRVAAQWFCSADGYCVLRHVPLWLLSQITACMIGTTIALRYAADRPQFGSKLIGDYLTHQRRLLPGLATTYALQLGMKQLKVCSTIHFQVATGPRRRFFLGGGGAC